MAGRTSRVALISLLLGTAALLSAPRTASAEDIAIGYDFSLLPNEMTSPSVGVTDIDVSTLVGNGDYQFFLRDLAGNWIDVAAIDAGQNFSVVNTLASLSPLADRMFGITDPSDGLTDFLIRGLSPSAALDPTDTSAFDANLGFSDTPAGDVEITPVVLDTVTEVDPPGTGFMESFGALGAADPVVEPSSISIFAAGLLGVGLLRRRADRLRINRAR